MWTTTTTSSSATTTPLIAATNRWSPATPPGIKEEKQQHLAGVGLPDHLHSPGGAGPHVGGGGGHSPNNNNGGGMHSPSAYPPPSFADSIVFGATSGAPPPPNTTTSGGPGDILYDTINMSQSSYQPLSNPGRLSLYWVRVWIMYTHSLHA